ncbi:HupE/UreJ family protein [Halieaceae bacterium]|nr:HupE/UreJ family protein [Halieaceae bacterium]
MHRRYLAPLLLLAPGIAAAHSPMQGIGHFYGGILHPVLVPSHLLALLALGLLVGQRGVRAMQIVYPCFLVALLMGLTRAGFSTAAPAGTEPVLLLIAGCCGLLAALAIPVPRVALALAALLGAFVVGADSGVENLNRQETFGALFGAGVGACIVLIVVAGLAEMPRRDWQRIMVRILGSWCAASAALVLALALR